jgi:hypothetical protein
MAPVASVKRAAKHLHDRAGIATGDVASHYLNEEKWAGANRTARIKLQAEVLYEE